MVEYRTNITHCTWWNTEPVVKGVTQPVGGAGVSFCISLHFNN